MERRFKTGTLFLLSALMMFCGRGCHSTDYGKGTPGKSRPLPATVPAPPDLQFTSTAEGWPPRPRDRTNVAAVPTMARPNALTEVLEAELRTAALQDSRVRTALGERFAYIAAAEVEPVDKRTPPPATGPLPVRLTFYSYSNNVAVDVLLRGREVAEVLRREGYQPPEGPEEIAEAVALARRDERVGRYVEGMGATAILTYEQPNQASGHRVLHVSFTPPAADAPRYYALVDLTGRSVVAAGPVAER